MIPGESLCSGASDVCDRCRRVVTLAPLSSAAGWYLGTVCDCGPYSRESIYYPSRELLDTALQENRVVSRV